MENFRNNKIYYYTPLYYPGFSETLDQKEKHLYHYPYLKKSSESDLDLRIFYNIIDKKNNVPWGSTYKYNIPKTLTVLPKDNSFNSVSERQKRFSRREFFADAKPYTNTKNNSNKIIKLILIFVIIFMIIY